MNKKEQIWREILQKVITRRQFEFTQKDLAKNLEVSLSTVFNALKIPRAQGAIVVRGRDFSVVDAEKFLYIWATQRNIEKEIIYQTYAAAGAQEIEGLMPAGTIFAAYSAYRQKYGDAPADYDKVYVYATQGTLDEIKKRFPKRAGTPNLFALKSDPGLPSFGNVAPEAQIFCDLWNLKDWYAKDFLKTLKDKLSIG
jgi:DNA-binding transcriptional regulator YhcF (GntR family)